MSETQSKYGLVLPVDPLKELLFSKLKEEGFQGYPPTWNEEWIESLRKMIPSDANVAMSAAIMDIMKVQQEMLNPVVQTSLDKMFEAMEKAIQEVDEVRAGLISELVSKLKAME